MEKKKANRYRQISKAYFDKKAANYEESWDGRFSASMYADILEKVKLFSFDTILDVGCGTGSILAMVIKEFKGVKAYGLDISEKMLERASAVLGNNAQLVVGDSAHLPWPDNNFDLVVCNSSFHHYPDPLKVLTDMRRVLKPDGHVIIADPWWPLYKRSIINLYLNSPFNYLGDVRIYSKQEMHTLLAACKYKDIKWELIKKQYSICTAAAGK
jgi:ubiquinone/menaquinone biosynthesis C-methylase UbiE